MSERYKFHNPDGIYFVSFAVVEWMNIFITPCYTNILLESLTYCQNNKGMEISSWCIMPNHLHLVYRIIGEGKPGLVLGDFKRFTSKKLVNTIRENPNERKKSKLLKRFKEAATKSSNVNDYQFWRHDNHPVELWSNHIIDQKINYVHQNPVKGGLVDKAEDYLYSSARDYAGEKGLLNDVLIIR